MITGDRSAKLLDFGLAKPLHAEPGYHRDPPLVRP